MPEGADVLRELLISIGVFTDPGAEDALNRLNTATDKLRANAMALAQAAGETEAATAKLREEQRQAKLRVDQANEALSRQRQTVQQLTGVVTTLGRGLFAASTALAGLVAGGVALATSAARSAEAIERQAASLRISTDAVQELQFAFGVFDASGDLFAQTLLTIQDRATQALEGSEQLTESFADLGITLRELRTLSPEQRFEALADGVANADNEGKALSATFRILGEDVARRLTPMLLDGAAGIRQLRQEARDLGLVTDSQTLRASAKLSLQWRRLTQVGRALREEIGQALVPTVERVVDRTLAWVRANRELISERVELFVDGLTNSMRFLIPVVGSLTVGFLALGVAIKAARIGSAVVAFAAANPVLALIIAVIGVLVVGILGWILVIEDLIFWIKGYDSAIEANLEELAKWVPQVRHAGVALGNLRDMIRDVARWIGRFSVAFRESLEPVQKLLDLIERLTSRLGELREGFDVVPTTLDARLQRGASGLRGFADRLAARAGVAAADIQGRANNTTNNTTRTTNLTQNVSVQSPGGVDGGVADFIDGVLRNGRAAVAGGVR